MPFLLLVLLLTFSAHAQETFQYVGGQGSQTWESAGNWTGGSGSFSSYPGESPQAGTLDNADLVSARTADLDLVLNGNVDLDSLTLGATGSTFLTTTVSGTGGALLSANEINSGGFVLSINKVDVDLRIADDLNIGGTLPLEINGDLVNDNPAAGTSRRITNDTNGTVDFRGNIILSNSTSDAGFLFFENGGSSETTVRGVISDGMSAGGRVTYAKGNFDIRSSSIYTGVTQIGSNNPESASLHTIHTDQPFGFGRVDITGGTSVKRLRGAPGKGTRTLANDFQLSRELHVVGTESIVINGTVSQANSTVLTNELIDPNTNTLTFNGDIYAADSNDLRNWRFEGTGRTIVNGIIDDSLGFPAVTGSNLIVDVSDKVILTNPTVAAYGGDTQVLGGTLQLGDGGAAVNLNDQDVTGDSILDIFHSTSMTFAPRLTDTVDLHHTGSGTTTLDRVSTGSGDIVVSAGTLLVNAGDGVTSGTGSGPVSVAGGTLGGTGHVGAAVTATAGGTIAPGTSAGELSLASLSLPTGSMLDIELGDIGLNEFDTLAVQGDLLLGGTLNLSELPSISVSSSTSLTIIDVGGTLTGEFAGLSDGALVGNFGGVDLFIDYDAGDGNDIGLFAAGTSPGDFNTDGQVNGLDFLLWQTDPNVGNLADWEAGYGSPLTTGASAVPEPGTLTLVLAAAFFAFHQRSRALSSGCASPPSSAC